MTKAQKDFYIRTGYGKGKDREKVLYFLLNAIKLVVAKESRGRQKKTP